MKLTHLKIKNLRAIESVELDLRPFTSLIGPNNCGKSTVIRAIEILLNQVTPAAEEWRSGAHQEELIVEARFEDLKEWERNAQGVAGLVYDGKIQVRVVGRIEPEGGKPEVHYEAFKPEETIEGWAESWSDLDAEIKAIATEMTITGQKWRTAANRERVKERVRERYPARVRQGAARWSNESVSIKAALQQALPQAQVIPAVRDASEDGSPGAKTSFGLLLSKLIIPSIIDTPEYAAFVASVDRLREKVGDADEGLAGVKRVMDDLSLRLAGIIDAKVKITVDAPDAEKFLGASSSLRLDDGVPTKIGHQGHGLQRALIFAMLEMLAKTKARERAGDAEIRSTLLLFEEPELFLHPHIMRRLKKALHTIAVADGWQVVVSTHSPFMIDVGEDPRSLVIFRREGHAAPAKTQLAEDPFGGDDPAVREQRNALRAVLDFHPSVCEAFFAKRTVLVEGASEKALLSHSGGALEVFGITDARRKDVTIVACVGKWTIVPFANLLKRFEVPFRVIHDIDAKGRSAAELAVAPGNDPYKANEKIAAIVPLEQVFKVDDTLEDVLWEERPGASSDKPFRAWKRIQELADASAEERAMYPKLVELLNFVFPEA